jgi:hypothetical protein
VAVPRIRFNEGSLLRRTLLHVATFVAGSAAFIGIVSFALVSMAKGLVTPRTEAVEQDAPAVASASPTLKTPAAFGRQPVGAPMRPASKRSPVPGALPVRTD